MEQTLLLVDDEQNILSSLTRLLRRDGYRILTALGGAAGLDILSREDVGVIISDQRMPGMSGAEFLSRVRDMKPDTVRMILSGYTDLDTITDAINRGAVFKFLTKPWDDELLRTNVREAFAYQGMARENERLTEELRAANEDLERRVQEKTREALRNVAFLRVAQEVLEALPLPVLGIGADGLIAAANGAAAAFFDDGGGPLVGAVVGERLPPEFQTLLARAREAGSAALACHSRGDPCTGLCRAMAGPGEERGYVVVLISGEGVRAAA